MKGISLFSELPPTAGLPIYGKDLLSFARHQSRRGMLEDDFKKYLGLPYAEVTCSGTAALYMTLEGMKQTFVKRTVLMPAYICPLVPLAIHKAGFAAEVCDIREGDLNFDPRELEEICDANEDIMAMVVVHLGGIPADFDAIKAIAAKKGILIIEDCAQSLGAMYQGRKTGTLGDAAFFSLCRGKGLTIYEGGIVAAGKKELAEAIGRSAAQLTRTDLFSEALKVLELFGYWVFYRPQLFWFAFRLPERFWIAAGQRLRAAREYYSEDFPLHRVSGFRKAIGHTAFYRLEDEIESQRRKAASYMEALKEVNGLMIIRERSGDRATYPYLTILFEDPERRNEVLRRCEREGLGASFIYVSDVSGYEYLRGIVPKRPFPKARAIAERSITVPTGTYVREGDIARVAGIIKNSLRRS